MVSVSTALVLLLVTVARGEAASDSGAEVRASHVYHLSKFVEWPRAAFESDDAPLQICVVGDRVGPPLERLAGRNAKGRTIRVGTAGRGALARCQIVVFPEGSAEETRPSELDTGQALTVGEGERFAEAGGIVGFVEGEGKGEGKVGLAVNARQAKRAGLRLSSRLLQLSKIVDASGAEAR